MSHWPMGCHLGWYTLFNIASAVFWLLLCWLKILAKILSYFDTIPPRVIPIVLSCSNIVAEMLFVAFESVCFFITVH